MIGTRRADKGEKMKKAAAWRRDEAVEEAALRQPNLDREHLLTSICLL